MRLRVVAVCERVVRSLHFDAQGRAHQVEFLAEPSFEETLVGIGDVLERIAVDHDHGRVHATLVGVPHLGAEHARALGGLELHRLQQQPGQHRGGHLARGGFVRLRDRRPQRTQALALLRGDEVQRGELQERQARFDGALEHLPAVIVHGIPFVHREDHRTPAFEDVAGDVRVLVGHTLGGVQQQQHDVGGLDGLQGLDHRELLDGLEHLALAPQACGVDELELLPVALEGHGDRVPRRAGHVEGDEAFLAEPGVDERGLAHIGPAGDGQADGLVLAVFRLVLGLGELQRLKGRLEQAADTLPVGRGDGQDLAQTQLVELGQLRALAHALGLVAHEQAGFAEAPQVVGDVVVLGRQARACIHDEDDDVRFRDGLLGLLGHLAVDARRGIGLEASGIDDDVFVLAQLAVAVVPITREAREIGDDGVARFREPVEQGGLAHVGAAHQGDDWLHPDTFLVGMGPVIRDGTRRCRRCG